MFRHKQRKSFFFFFFFFKYPSRLHFIFYFCCHRRIMGGIPLPSRGIVGKNWSTQNIRVNHTVQSLDFKWKVKVNFVKSYSKTIIPSLGLLILKYSTLFGFQRVLRERHSMEMNKVVTFMVLGRVSAMRMLPLTI